MATAPKPLQPGDKVRVKRAKFRNLSQRMRDLATKTKVLTVTSVHGSDIRLVEDDSTHIWHRTWLIKEPANTPRPEVPKVTEKSSSSDGGLFTELERRIMDTVQTTIGREVSRFKTEVDTKLELVEDQVKTGHKLTVIANDKAVEVKGAKHSQLTDLIKLAGQRIPTLMVGMAGTGKTHAGEQTAEALGLKFYAISVGAQTSKSDIMGYMHANGGYVRSLFRDAYEKGGVFLMDEIDAGNSNVLIQINSALANHQAAFPDGMVAKHDDFVFIATANTFGHGASRMYVGRNQLDAATLDRFAIIDWQLDTKLEDALVYDDDAARAWVKVVRELRREIESSGVRALITPRATLRGQALLSQGMSFGKVLDIAVLAGLPSDNQAELKDRAGRVWREHKIDSLPPLSEVDT